MPEDTKSSLKKNVSLWVFLGAALAVVIVLAVFLSPFASSSPDGLEKVAEDKGFMKAAEDARPAWSHSPLPDYQVTAVKSEKVSTGLSGLFGILITLAVALLAGSLAYGIGRVWKKKHGPEEGTPVNEA